MTTTSVTGADGASMTAAVIEDPIAGDLELGSGLFAGGRRHLWILRRVALALVTLLVVSIIVFVATQVLPGNAATAILGQHATPSRVAQLSRQLHLDRSAVSQYLSWLGSVVHGQFGTSLAAQEPVTTLMGSRVVNTLLLVLFSAIITLPLSIVLGIRAAVRRDRVEDHAFSVVTLVLNAVPDFVVGMLVVVLLATNVLHLLPAISLIPQGTDPLSNLKAFILPVATLVIVDVPYLARLVRASMIDVLGSEYVQLARLKGLSERRILFRHALPNALVPTIQGAAQVLAYMAGGIVVVEYIFSFPGLGGGLLTAVQNRDIPTIQFATLVLAAFYVVVNLAADVATVAVSPRLRTGGR